MSLSLRSRSAGLLSFAVVVGLSLFAKSASAQNKRPVLRNVTFDSPIQEHGYTMVVCGVNDPNRLDRLKLTINWGDGTSQRVKIPNGNLRYITNYHTYRDRATSSVTDGYRISLRLTDPYGAAAVTNLFVTVTNALDVGIAANSPIVENAPATEQALEFTEFRVPTRGSYPHGITEGPDGNIWFTEADGAKIGRLTPAGVLTEFPVIGARSLAGICAGPDGKLWFTAFQSDKIGRITTSGAIRLFNIPHPNWPLRAPVGITPGPDGTSVWFAGWGYRLGRMALNGTVTKEITFPSGWNFSGISTSSDGDLWATVWSQDVISRVDPISGVVTNFLLSFPANPQAITRGPDDAMWFTQYQLGRVGRISLDNQLTEFEVGDNAPYGITTGPDNALWWVEQRPTNSAIVRCRMNGEIQRFALPWLSFPSQITAGPDNAVYFTISGRNRIGRLRYGAAGNVVLNINLFDPSLSDRHSLIIDWGDGSELVGVTLPAGQRNYSAAHTYAGAGSYPVYVRAQDDDGTFVEARQTVEAVPAGTLQQAAFEANRLRPGTSSLPPTTLQTSPQFPSAP